MALAGVAHATLSSFDPSRGQVAPGGSTTATFDVTPPGLVGLGVSCIVGSAAPTSSPSLPTLGISVSFDQVCGTSREAEMTVAASASVSPGSYIVTITETELLVDGNLLGTYQWPLTVTGGTTTTSTPSTTTTDSPTSTTASTSGSPSTTPSPPPTTIEEGPRPPGTSPSLGAGGTSPPANQGPGTSTTVEDSADPVDDDDDLVFAIPSPTPGGGAGAGSTLDDVTATEEGRAVFASIAYSDRLRQALEESLPSMLTEVVLSPLVIGEVLVRSLVENVVAFLIPLALAMSLARLLVRRMRVEIGADEFEH
ncbi:MAG: hypothetical protein ACRDZM_14630 [Acidimicrobiia bacterium]